LIKTTTALDQRRHNFRQISSSTTVGGEDGGRCYWDDGDDGRVPTHLLHDLHRVTAGRLDEGARDPEILHLPPVGYSG
jgi:hypothetical protein